MALLHWADPNTSTIAMASEIQITVQMLDFCLFIWWRKLKGDGDCQRKMRPVSSAQSMTRLELLNRLSNEEKKQVRHNVDRCPHLATVAKLFLRKTRYLIKLKISQGLGGRVKT